MKLFWIAVIAIGAVLLLTGAAHAQETICADRKEFLGKLKTGWDEMVSGRGLVNNGSMVELVVAPKGKSWTLIVTAPTGTQRTCVVATGESWVNVPRPSPGEKL